MGVIKELAAETRDLPLAEGLRREAQGFIRCIGSEDGAEGVMAFLEKRQAGVHGPMKAAVLHETGSRSSWRTCPSRRPPRASPSSTSRPRGSTSRTS